MKKLRGTMYIGPYQSKTNKRLIDVFAKLNVPGRLSVNAEYAPSRSLEEAKAIISRIKSTARALNCHIRLYHGKFSGKILSNLVH